MTLTDQARTRSHKHVACNNIVMFSFAVACQETYKIG